MPEEANKAKAILKRAKLTLFFLLAPLEILLLTGPAFAAAPTVGFIIPLTGSTAPDTAKTFTCLYSDKDGWRNLKETYLLISASPAQLANSAYLYYDQNTNKLYLRNDANTAWLGGYTPGSSNTIENSQVKLNCRSTAVFGLINTLFVHFNITFKPVYSGKTYNTYLYVRDDTGGSAGWTQKGKITIQDQSDTTPPTGSISINNNAAYTASTSVTLSLSAVDSGSGMGSGARMQFSNDNLAWSTPEAYAITKSWNLPTGDGTKTVFVKYKDVTGNWSAAYSDTIILSTNHPPVINAVTPSNNSTFLAGAGINIQIDASDPDNDPLEYQFSIGGTVKQAWSSSNTYIWQTSSADTGAVSVTCEVRDDKYSQTSKTISYSIINPTVEEILRKVADNYAKISDFTADMTLSSTLDGKPFGATDYCRYYFKAPNKEKTETFNDAARQVKNDIIIISGANMHLIDPINNIKQSVDLLADAGISSTEFSQLDLYYNQALFLSKNTVSRNDLNTDFDNMIIVLDVSPKEETILYSKLELYLDYKKGLLVKIVRYKNDELPQVMEVIETKQMPNGAWLASKLKKIPNLKAGNLIVILSYDNIQINTGLTDSNFDPDKQF